MEYESAHSWSVRNIAEHAYCPRLFYLMEVEGLHLDNEHTAEGKLIHKTVDRPSAKRPNHPEGNQPRENALGNARSLTLYDKDRELMGILDYVEFDGGFATPVEYRKGHAPDQDKGLWEVDSIQLGLQAHLLTLNGYRVEQVGVYYSRSNAKRYFTIDSSFIQDALNAVEEAKFTARSNCRPKPTADIWKCNGCSLAELCLPHETTALHSEGRKTLPYPPRMDGLHVVAQSDGVMVGCRGKCLQFKNSDRKIIKEMPLMGMEALTVYGNIQVSTNALAAMANNGIHVTYATRTGRLLFCLDSGVPSGVHIRKAQFEKLSDEKARLELARHLIVAKISNQRTVLLRNARNEKSAASALKELKSKAGTAPSIESLRGIEGAAARLYFQGIAKAIKNDEIANAFARNGRKRRPAPDPFNSCLSFCYALLANECTTALSAAHLDPGLGALHEYRPGRPALACDLMEVFRPIIADSVALSLFNKRFIKTSDFRTTAEGVLLKEAGRKTLIECMERRMRDTITHSAFGYTLEYRRMLHLHAKLIAGWLRDDYDSLDFIMTR